MKRILVLAILLSITASLLIAQDYTGKKVLFVDSYHEGYAWSDGVTNGVQSIIKPSGATLKIVRMDTKNNPSEEFKQKAAKMVKETIDSWKPDVVITADDNAAKYVIMQYYKDSDIPFVFCGVNWDASGYGMPYKNTTGMIEVAPIKQLVEMLKKYAKGEKIGYIEADNFTAKKEAENYTKKFGLQMEEIYVQNFEEWKKGFAALQSSVDMLIVGNNAGISGWNDAEAEKFVLENAAIPIGTIYDWMANYALIGFTKVADEQGSWAAKAAIKILGGTKPSNIELAQNKEGNVILNMKIAKKLNAQFTTTLIKGAQIIK